MDTETIERRNALVTIGGSVGLAGLLALGNFSEALGATASAAKDSVPSDSLRTAYELGRKAGSDEARNKENRALAEEINRHFQAGNANEAILRKIAAKVPGFDQLPSSGQSGSGGNAFIILVLIFLCGVLCGWVLKTYL